MPVSHLDPARSHELTANWNGFMPSAFAVDEGVLARQVFDPVLHVPEASFEWGAGFVAVKRTPHGRLYDGPTPNGFTITALTSPELLGKAIEQIRVMGGDVVYFGTDSDHLLPGLPQVPGWEGQATLEAALAVHGFRPGQGFSVDLERDLAGYTPPSGCLEAMDEAGCIVRTAKPEDEDSLDQFFIETFPNRWRHDVMRKFRSGEGRQIDVLIRDGVVVGFSMTQDESSIHPVGGAVWKRSLGPSWASLGPIGISASVRGLGLGAGILGASLKRLADAGARQTIIDWTTLVSFYGAHGFEPSRTYRHWTLTLS